MLYFSDQELDALILEDIPRGDLTSRTLNLSNQTATIEFRRKQAGPVAGLDVAAQMLQKLGLTPEVHAAEGDWVEGMALVLSAQGRADRLHSAWKVVQVVLEWCGGVAQCTRAMVESARVHQPHAQVACTRKSIPGTRKLATAAVIAGGGTIHRSGLSDSLLVFTNHRNLLTHPEDYRRMVDQARSHAPEHKLAIEADNLDQLPALLAAGPDIIQLDKFTPAQVADALALKQQLGASCQLSVAGGINPTTIAEYAEVGASLFITSAPYYAPPQDIKVVISPN
ncbi:ModD protein [Ferrimonas futtsuensis]|uniref:ModD protein n=1 Tax=Ferrimonas futtsuensis TaxID=364764 RepID=UPI0004159823|nr:ModD protein [Ferrimonas futtsuensis]